MSRSINELPRWVQIGLMPLLNVMTAFIVSGFVISFLGEDPFEAVMILLDGALGRGEAIGYTLFYTTNFIFTGLAVAVAAHAGLFNIGGEGQAYVGGLGVILVCLGLDAYLPWWAILPFALLAAIAFGAAWAAIPAYLQAKRGSHIVITTIMFNFIATSLIGYLLVNVMKTPGTQQPETRVIAEGARLPFLRDYSGVFGLDLGHAPVNLSLLIALAAAVLLWLLLWRTRLGYAIRVMGFNPHAGTYAGLKTDRIVIIAMLLSGGLAGMMALNIIMGEQHRLLLDYTAGYGFVGIAVALMGRSHPVGILLAALLFGILYQGGAELAFAMQSISRDMIIAIQGLIILFAGAMENLYRPVLLRLFAIFHRDSRPEEVA